MSALDPEEIRWHYDHPVGLGDLPDCPHAGVAGGAACGDLIKIRLQVGGSRISGYGFDAQGCGALVACASAFLQQVQDMPVLQAAAWGADRISDLMGGLSPTKFHAAELTADAFHQALGQAIWADGYCPQDPDLTLVALSGGVDSSVVAHLLQAEGKQLAGVTVELWRDPDNFAQGSCCSYSAVRRARLQAHRLGMPHFTLPLLDQFRQGVVEPYIRGHQAGITPNPCVACNGDVRLDAMLAFADRIGAKDLATGHYAQIISDETGVLVARGVDVKKDQSYMLAGVKPETLARINLPLGSLAKQQVREIAQGAGLIAAKTPDSQDLCFLSGTDRHSFLAKHGGLHTRPGQILDLKGQVLGTHQGAHLYTVGQRKGLGVSLGVPTYVIRVDAKHNQIVVGSAEDLNQAEVRLGGVRMWRQGSRVNQVRLRSKQQPLACQLGESLQPGNHPRARLLLGQDPDGGVSPGQSAVLMDGEVVVGVATILAG